MPDQIEGTFLSVQNKDNDYQINRLEQKTTRSQEFDLHRFKIRRSLKTSVVPSWIGPRST